MITKRFFDYTIQRGDSMSIKSFGVVELPCTCDNTEYILVSVAEDITKFKQYFHVASTTNLKIKNTVWLACVKKDLHDTMQDRFYDTLMNVVIPMYDTGELSIEASRQITRDILNYREATVFHYGNEARSTDFYNCYKWLNSYRDMITKMLIYSKDNKNPSKEYCKFIDNAFKYLKEREGGLVI